MTVNIRGTRLSADTLFACAVTLMFIFDKSGSAQTGLCAAAFHEFGHLLCMAALSDMPRGISLTPFGMRITRLKPAPSYFVEALEAAAGPAANLLLTAVLVLLSRFCGGLKKPAYINLFMAVFNLLPVEPLDGGRLLRCLLSVRADDRTAERITKAATAAGSILLVAAGAALLVKSGYNFTMLAVSLYLLACLFAPEGGGV